MSYKPRRSMLLAAHESTNAFCSFLLILDPSKTVRPKALGYPPSSSSFVAAMFLCILHVSLSLSEFVESLSPLSDTWP
ncbi:hypothetical protein M6B38_354740 [Iris pallida]|uniref:Uncharacterized protein n=1 Tax=Iris pallida TaxID=29817 RepID=A0AAX6GP17_IRIPA|nr:hypothetical protein M6B38_354740 [Iris pallida]